MSHMDELKLVITFSECPGQPPLMDDEVQQVEGETMVCIKCPTRAGGLIVETEEWVAESINSDPGSKGLESRCKTMGGIATCFHCHRWGYKQQA